MANRELTDLMGMSIVSTAEAREVGHVQEVLFDPSNQALFGLVVDTGKKGDDLQLVLFDSIRTIGKDAITLVGQDTLQLFESNPGAKQISEAGGYRDGMTVMTESGESVGKVDGVTINEDGRAMSYHSTTGFFGSKHDIEASEVISGSGERLIISDNAREGAANTVSHV